MSECQKYWKFSFNNYPLKKLREIAGCHKQNWRNQNESFFQIIPVKTESEIFSAGLLHQLNNDNGKQDSENAAYEYSQHSADIVLYTLLFKNIKKRFNIPAVIDRLAKADEEIILEGIYFCQQMACGNRINRSNIITETSEIRLSHIAHIIGISYSNHKMTYNPVSGKNPFLL